MNGFGESFDLPEVFAEGQIEELVDFFDLGVRVVLLDNMVSRIVRTLGQAV